MRDLILLDGGQSSTRAWRGASLELRRAVAAGMCDAAASYTDRLSERVAELEIELAEAREVCEAATDFFREPSPVLMIDLGRVVRAWETRAMQPGPRLPMEDA